MYSYNEMRKRREAFRSKLVKLIMMDPNDHQPTDVNAIPSESEKQLLRYYYYIKHGIDTTFVSKMDNKVLKRIMRLIPPNYKQFKNILQMTIDEAQSEYIFAVKKAVVDFALGDTLNRIMPALHEMPDHRQEVRAIANRYRHLYDENRRLMNRNLYAINPCVQQTFELLHTLLKKSVFVDGKGLAAHNGAFDLYEFKVFFFVF